MALRNVFVAVFCAILLAWSTLSVAEEYKPDEFLGLDLSTAVLSPKPLGPAQKFAPVPVEAGADRGGDGAQARMEPDAAAGSVVPRAHVEPHIAHVRSGKPRGAARTMLTRRHGNPLDAQAFDTRIQVWPCKSGGICDWKR